MSRAALNEKKLAVLQVVKEKRHILFSSCHNNPVKKYEKEVAWTEVLRKAQDLGLASSDRGWIYARDHIFGLWKSRTLAKANNVKTKIDAAILEILQIAGGPIAECQDSSEADHSESKSQGAELHENQSYPLDGVEIKTENVDSCEQLDHSLDETAFITESSEMPRTVKRKARNVRDSAKRKWDNSDSINSLRKQVLRTELHKNKLLILELERKLGLPPSKFTYDLQNQY